jgi:hypothetical protein
MSAAAAGWTEDTAWVTVLHLALASVQVMLKNSELRPGPGNTQ